MRWDQAKVSRIGELESQLLEMGEMVCARHLIRRRKAEQLAKRADPGCA